MRYPRCPDPITLTAEYLHAGQVWRREVLTPCKRYTCRHCGRGRRARIARHLEHAIAEAARRGQRLRFVTFTYPLEVPAEVAVRDHVIDTSTRLRRVVQRLRRQGVTMEYGRVLEATKRDRIHVHALMWGAMIPKCNTAGRRSRGLPTGRGSGSPCYCTPDRPCIQRAAWSEGFGWVDVRAVKTPREAVSYVMKYLAKQLHRQSWPRHARRYSYSRNFAGGMTLAAIDAEYLAPFLADVELAEREWFGRSLPRPAWHVTASQVHPHHMRPWRLRPPRRARAPDY